MAALPVALENPTRDVTLTPTRTSRRVPELDILRGFLLVWMTLTHLPTRVSAYSNQMAGYVSAAEGFIFLAAFLVGQIQRREREKYGSATAVHKLLGRAWRIYRYHLALLAVAFSLGAVDAIYLHRIPLQNLLDFYLQHPKVAVAAAPALLYNPPLFDILPLYIVFMLLTPLLLALAGRFGWRPVLAGSSLVWVLAQFHLRVWFYGLAAKLGFPVPLHETGAFDLFGWQFLWTAGLALGTTGAVSRVAGQGISKRWLTFAAAVAAILFICRHTAFDALVGPGIFGLLVDKWKLGILRLVDFAAIGILLVRFGPGLAHTRVGTSLAPLGRASLEVFSAHVLFCIAALGLSTEADPHFLWWQQGIILAITLAGLFAVANRTERRRAQEGRTTARLAEASSIARQTATAARPSAPVPQSAGSPWIAARNERS